MIKTYKANTNVSINIVLASKKNLHISFTPLSNGSSTFTTDNEEVMKAIESHYNFGKLFRLFSVQGESVKKATKAVEQPKTKVEKKEDAPAPVEDTDDAAGDENEVNPTNEAEDTDEGNDNEDAGEESTLKKVTVSDFASAKDYLADTFGISRTTLRSQKAILEQAAANGIEFVGLS